MSARRPRVLVVEDEDLARERLTRMLGEHPDYELVAACRNGLEARAAFETTAVDIALVDIEMPGVSGMELLQMAATGEAPAPLVILTTAHSQFAVDAFAGRAVDYVLKPFDRARLEQALQTARERLEQRGALAIYRSIRSSVDELPLDRAARTNAPTSHRFVVRAHGRLRLIPWADVAWIGADGHECVLHCADGTHRIDGPLRVLAEQLRAAGFAQASRSALVNLEHVRELQEMFKGDLIALLASGEQVPVSRRYKTHVLAQLGA
ncbi:MAG TPA: LytTR family DNA-binding domain-containing protein [Rhodanobacteraceae bacterium]